MNRIEFYMCTLCFSFNLVASTSLNFFKGECSHGQQLKVYEDSLACIKNITNLDSYSVPVLSWYVDYFKGRVSTIIYYPKNLFIKVSYRDGDPYNINVTQLYTKEEKEFKYILRFRKHKVYKCTTSTLNIVPCDRLMKFVEWIDMGNNFRISSDFQELADKKDTPIIYPITKPEALFQEEEKVEDTFFDTPSKDAKENSVQQDSGHEVMANDSQTSSTVPVEESIPQEVNMELPSGPINDPHSPIVPSVEGDHDTKINEKIENKESKAQEENTVKNDVKKKAEVKNQKIKKIRSNAESKK